MWEIIATSIGCCLFSVHLSRNGVLKADVASF